MRNWSLVPSEHQNPFKALSAAYPMNSGAEKEPHEEKEPQEEEEPCEETNPHKKP